MEEDILNYSPTVMFRGTPCSSLGVYSGYPNKMRPELLPDTFIKQHIQRFTVQKRSGFLEDLAKEENS